MIIDRAHVMKTHNAEGEKEGEDDIMDRREQLLQTRNTIQERVRTKLGDHV